MNFQNYQWKWKIAKHFARPKQRAAFRKLFNFPPHPTTYQIKPYHVSGTKISLRWYKEIYRHLLSKCFKNTVKVSRNGAVQIFFLTQDKKREVCWKFIKSERLLAVFREHIIFNVKWVKVCKMSEFFLAKLYCKMCNIFC